MLSAVEHALLKWKMQSSVVEHEASQVIYRYGFMFTWVDAINGGMAEFPFCVLVIWCKNVSIVELNISLKKRNPQWQNCGWWVFFFILWHWMLIKVWNCEFGTFYWYLCDFVFTCTWFNSNQNAHLVDTLMNFSIFAIYEFLKEVNNMWIFKILQNVKFCQIIF